MRVTLSFHLPQEEDSYKLAIDGQRYFSSLYDLDNWLRGLIKYDEHLSDASRAAYECVRSELHRIMADNRVSLDDVS